MTIARTARRRRKQYAMGQRGLAQIFGKTKAPLYSKRQPSAARLARWAENKRKGLF